MSGDVAGISEADANRETEAARRQAEIEAFEAEQRRIEAEARQARLEARQAQREAERARAADEARSGTPASDTDPRAGAGTPPPGTLDGGNDADGTDGAGPGIDGAQPGPAGLVRTDPAQVAAVLADYEARGDALVAEVRAPAEAARDAEYEALRDMNGPLGGLIRREDVAIPLSRRGDVLEQQIGAIERYKRDNPDWEDNPLHRQNVERALAATVLHEAQPRAQGMSPGEAGTAILNVGAGLVSLPGNVFNLVTNRDGALDAAIEAGGQALGRMREFAGDVVTGAFNLVTGRPEAPDEAELASQAPYGLPAATTGDRNLDRAGQQVNGLLDTVFRAIDPSSVEGRVNLTEGLIQAGIASQMPAANDLLGRTGQQLAQRNAAIVAAREGTTPASTLVSRALDTAQDALNTRTAATLGAREISASTRNLPLQPMPAHATQPIAFADAIRYPASNLTPTLGQQLSHGVRQGVEGASGILSAGAARLQQAAAPLTGLVDEAMAGPKSFMDNVNQLNAQVRRSVDLATTGQTLGPITATVHSAIDMTGAAFNLAAQTTKPLWQPVLNAVSEGAKTTVALTGAGLGLGYATGNLRSGSFVSSEPQNAFDEQARAYINLPPNLDTTYLWAGSDPEGPVALAGCAWGGGIRRMPMANPLDESQRIGSPPRLNVSPKGASLVMDSPILGPTLMCSAQVRGGDNYGLAYTAVALGGRTATPNNTFLANNGGLTARTGAQTGPLAVFSMTDASLGEVKVTAGNMLSFGAVGINAGTDGVGISTQPFLAVPFFSAAPNLTATPGGEEKPEHRMIREFLGIGEPRPAPAEPAR